MDRVKEESQEIFHHTNKERRFYLVLFFVVAIAITSGYYLLAGSTYHGNATGHSVMEMVGAFFGLAAGLSLIVYFYTLGNRFFLLLGLAFFVNGAEDLVHGIMSFPYTSIWLNLPKTSLARYIPGTYVAGRIHLSVLLIAASIIIRRFSVSKNSKKETFIVGGGVIIISMILTYIAFLFPLPKFIYPELLISRPVDFISAVLLFIAGILFFYEYFRNKTILTWWILLSILVNCVGQVFMSFSKELYDQYFDIAHVYKVIGYLIPLIGFTIYQIKVIVDRQNATNKIGIYSKKLEKSNSELRDFIYIASHDLQEPLRKIHGFGDILKRKFSDKLDEQGIDYLSRMQNASGRMQILLNDLLDYSRITTKAKPFVLTDLNNLVVEVLEDLDSAIHREGATIELGVLPTLEVDKFQVKAVFRNLFSNAIKFHKKDQPPKVKIYCENNTKCVYHPEFFFKTELYQIVVEDNGIGIAEEYWEKVFEVFEKLNKRTDYEGTGIGLALVRKIVERHFGKIRIESELNQGSKFIITLPKQQNEEAII